MSVSVAALVALSPRSAAAQTWTGATSNNWLVGSNWSGGVPGGGLVTINTTSPNATVIGVDGAANATSGQIYVGRFSGGSGNLTIQNGSTLTSISFGRVGELGTGVMTVTGPGSTWNINSNIALIVGNSGVGTLNISNGGVVNANLGGYTVFGTTGTGRLNLTGGGKLNASGSGYLGSVTGGLGIANVSGAGSQWNITQQLYIGDRGTGTLTIENGGEVVAQNGTIIGNQGTGSGILNINASGTLETLSLGAGLSTTTTQVNFNGGTLQATNNNAAFITGFSGTELNIAAGGVTVDTAGFNVGTDSTSAFTGVGGLTKTGAGTLSLAANNIYGGETLIQAGTLALTGIASIANSSRVVADGTFDISGLAGAGASIQSLGGSSSGVVNLGAKTLTITNANDTFAGVIGGTGELAVSGGTQTLSGANTYSGTTRVLGSGMLIAANDFALGNAGGGTTVSNGATLALQGNLNLQESAINLSGAGVGGNGALRNLAGNNAVNLVNLQSNSRIQVDAGVLTVKGTMPGTGGLTVGGPGTLILTGFGTYTGGTTIDPGATLQLGAGGTTGSIFNRDVVNNGAFVFNRSNTLSYSAVISGSGEVRQIGTGTTNLSGANTYTGQTWIRSGVLALTGSGAIASSSRVVADGAFDISAITPAAAGIQSLAGSGTVTLGAKTLTITNANDVFSGVIGGTGGLDVSGGIQTLSGANNYSGTTTVRNGGTLRAGAANTFSAASGFNVNAGGTLNLAGFDQTLSSLDNAGVVTLGGAPGTNLIVNGNYTGSGGLVNLNTVLGGDASPSDRLIVNGSTSGISTLHVANVGGTGAPTTEGIKVVDVSGASNGAFSLLGDYMIQGQQAVVGGAYAYTLQQNGVSTPADGDWYLRSSLINPPPAAPPGPLYQPGVPLYENYAAVLLGMNEAPSLQQRVGNRYWGGSAAMARAGVNTAQADPSWTQSAFWGRIEGGQANLQQSTTTGSRYNSDQVKAQTGLDGVALDNDRGQLIVGLTAQYGLTTAYVNSFFGNGRIRAEGAGVGATATWYGHDGFYADGQAQTMFYHADLSSALTGSMTHGNEGFGYAFSLEGGKRVSVGNGFWLTPHAQLAYSKVGFDSFSDRFGALVSLTNADSLLGRVGLSLNHQRTWNDDSGIVRSDLYAIGNLHYEFLDGSRIDVAGTSFASANDRLWGSIGGGGTYSWANGRYSVFGEATYRASIDHPDDNHGYKGTGGFRVTW